MKIAYLFLAALVVATSARAEPSEETSPMAPVADEQPIWTPGPGGVTGTPPPPASTRPGKVALNLPPYSDWLISLPGGCDLKVQLTDVDIQRPPGSKVPDYGDGQDHSDPVAVTQYLDQGPNGCSCTVSIERPWYNKRDPKKTRPTVAHELCHCAQGVLGMRGGQFTDEQLEKGASMCADQLVNNPTKTPTVYVAPPAPPVPVVPETNSVSSRRTLQP